MVDSYSEDEPRAKGKKGGAKGKGKKVMGKKKVKAPSASAWQGWHSPRTMTITIFVVHHVMTVILILGLFGSAWGVTPPVLGSAINNGTTVDDGNSASGTEFGLLYTRTITTTLSGVNSKATAASTAKKILSDANPAGVAAFVLLIVAMVLALVVNITLWIVLGHIFEKKLLHCCCPNTNLHAVTKFIMASIFIEFVLIMVAWAEWTAWWLKTGYSLNLKGIAEDTADQRTVQGVRTSLAAVYGALGWSNGLTLVAWLLCLAMLLILSLIAWWWCCCGKRADKKFKEEHGGASEADVDVEVSLESA
jgi:hypothetical protein